MSLPPSDNWDSALQEKRWRNSLEKCRQALDGMRQSLSASSPGFYILCLAEVDAMSSLRWPECFASRAAFVAELRRIIAEPTTPSRSVPSPEAYKNSQKWFLEMEIKQIEANT